MSRRTLFSLIFVPVLFGVLSVGASLWTAQAMNPAPATPHGVVTDGRLLYEQHCAMCHGSRGAGDGPAPIVPRARYFGFDKFRFATTSNGMPTDDDLARMIRNGIPGSVMPKFDGLTDKQVQGLISYLRLLTRQGSYERWTRAARKEDPDNPDWEWVAKKVETDLAVQSPVMPADLPRSADLANGKRIFDTSCAQCHGLLGKGDGPQEQRTDDGAIIRPRDLTTGIYKGGGRPEDLQMRIRLGVPGTPMPATNTLSPQEMADLIGYIQSLVRH
jgi:mono/diheme cytochrome c family protein